MYTDPKRIHATDPGTVEGNPVFSYHEAFNSDTAEVEDLKERYRGGRVGDVEVKQRLAKVLNDLLEPIRERRAQFEAKPVLVKEALAEGSRVGKQRAEATMAEVRERMKLDYLT
jgi:tryptophanyl-tRNA synthetase